MENGTEFPADSSTENAILSLIGAVYGILVIVVGGIGNVLVVVSVAINPKLQSRSNVFIVNLSVSDLIFPPLLFPFVVHTYLKQSWVFGQEFCLFMGYIMLVCTGVSLMNILVIAVNRYVLVAYPHCYDKLYSKKKIVANVVFIWVYIASLNALTLARVVGRFQFEEKIWLCSFDHNHLTHILLISFLGIILPIPIMLFCYLRVYALAQQSDRRAKAGSLSEERDGHRKHRSIIKMIAIIFTVYLVSYTPFMLVNILGHFLEVPSSLYVISSWLLFCGPWCNPIIYGAMNKNFWATYKHIIFKFFCVKLHRSSSSVVPTFGAT